MMEFIIARSQEQFEKKDSGLLVRAPAKINLSLVITGKRPDGFHNIETIMAKIDYYDEIFIEPSDKDTIDVTCDGAYWVPSGSDNLIYKAADLLFKRVSVSAGVKIRLTKNIPAGSGLGSGSSDAAATLVGLNKFMSLGCSNETLHELAAAIGSDVPFFLGPPLAYCTGRGEKIEKIEKIFDFSCILLMPDVNSSTASVYGNYCHDKTAAGHLSSQINSLLTKNRIDLIVKICANNLETSSFDLYEQLINLKSIFTKIGAGRVCLSGSGSTMFCITVDKSKDNIENYLRELGEQTGCDCCFVSNNRW